MNKIASAGAIRKLSSAISKEMAKEERAKIAAKDREVLRAGMRPIKPIKAYVVWRLYYLITIPTALLLQN
jgi:hypothetical protein